jgi:hypothetical protein
VDGILRLIFIFLGSRSSRVVLVLLFSILPRGGEGVRRRSAKKGPIGGQEFEVWTMTMTTRGRVQYYPLRCCFVAVVWFLVVGDFIVDRSYTCVCVCVIDVVGRCDSFLSLSGEHNS